jgi:hypothetical protein
MMLRQPEGIEAGAVAQYRKLAQLVQQLAIVALLGDVVRDVEIPKTHKLPFLLGPGLIWYTLSDQ